MPKYRIDDYYTWRGVKSIVNLGDFSYGEWIVYIRRKPKYVVNIFDQTFISNKLINEMINKYDQTMPSIIDRLNLKLNLVLMLERRRQFEFLKSSTEINLEIPPLPEEWVQNIYNEFT